MKQFSLVLIISILVSAGITYMMISYNTKKEKTGWISLSEVFNDFAFKKELEMKLKKTKDTRQALVDSLAFNLKLLSKQLQSENQKNKEKIALFEIRREEYLTKKQQFEADNDAVAKQYDAQIIAQMNQYVKDFGNKHGYTYIFGADGNGSLMYSLETKNITKEVNEYINNRYKGNTE
jgi:outer membrane protein